jgi:hypothetical protein|tara:strand:+ start:12749 stop:12856 length:108 start_codon:yes stop_codon:yes gene_type:complete
MVFYNFLYADVENNILSEKKKTKFDNLLIKKWEKE